MRRKRKIKKVSKSKKIEFSKTIVAWLLIHGTIWTYLSYYLAYLGRTEIAETLSKTVVVEILGATVVYALKSYLEKNSRNKYGVDEKGLPISCKTKLEEESSL